MSNTCPAGIPPGFSEIARFERQGCFGTRVGLPKQLRPAAFAKRSRLVLGLFVAALFALTCCQQAVAQTPIPVGAGSIADSVPLADGTTDSYFGLPAVQITGSNSYYQRLHLDPSLVGKPIPTNHWWTDLLVANRSNLRPKQALWDIKQDPYGGDQWFYPGMLAPRSYGLDLHFPNSWPTPDPTGNARGNIEKGPALQIHGSTPYAIPTDDILIADFERGYPAGTKRIGTGFGETPSPGEGLTGKVGNFCASTRDRGDGGIGTLVLPEFSVQKRYIHFLVCGGSSADTQVRMVVNGATALAASGENSTRFRWVTWDVSKWRGRHAHIEIGDQTAAGWGIICADQIFHSDAPDPAGRFGGDMAVTHSVVTNWGDWNVDFSLPDANKHRIEVTMARGIPFTWTRWTGLNPKIMTGDGVKFYDTNKHEISPKEDGFVASAFSFTYQKRAFGIFLPDDTKVIVSGDSVEPQLSGVNNYMVVGYLPTVDALADFAAVAYARPTDTKIAWKYDPAKGEVSTTWTVTTAAMKGKNLETFQGWLPHHYRTTTNNLAFKPYTYVTPRGAMKCSQGASFQISFPFKGIVPVLPAPKAAGRPSDYDPARMAEYLDKFDPGTMIGDTYWAGKSLALCAQYLSFAKQMGDTANAARLQTALKTAFADWFTYKQGKLKGIFCYYRDWKALIGWNASYGSQAFNDLHFHYGYFATAGSTLGMVDPQFLKDYGPMLRLLVKCYGNYDRSDLSEPFLRTFDVWEGHSNAGGTSSPGGENQESSSEAMQSWGGMFLLGSALQDKDMIAAGAMGYAMEGCAANEYWQDLYQTNFPPCYNRQQGGIIGSSGVAYGTFFSADPAWIYGIQYCPANHWNNYLVRYQPEAVKAKYQALWDERLAWCNRYPLWDAATSYKNGFWLHYAKAIYSAKGEVAAGGPTPGQPDAQWNLLADCGRFEPDAKGVPGHVVICYQAMFDPDSAAAEFEKYLAARNEIATSRSEAGATYYLIHAMRQAGFQDFDYTTNIPTSAIYKNPKTGARTCVVFNPSDAQQTVTVYKNGAVTAKFCIPAKTLLNQGLE